MWQTIIHCVFILSAIGIARHGITGAKFGAHRAPGRNARQHHADVVRPVGAHGGIEEELLQHILLGVAAAKHMHRETPAP